MKFLFKFLKQHTVSPSTGAHFDFLDGVRGIAILLVVMCHAVYCNPNAGPAIRFITQVTGAGTVGVPIFFVLSGFVIFYPFYKLREKDARAWIVPGYASRRIFKIAPPFLLSFVLLSGLYLLQFRDVSYIKQGLQWFVGLPNLSLPIFAENRFNAPLWSLVVEVQFYLVLPFLVLATRGLSARQTSYTIGALLIVVPMAIRFLTWPVSNDPQMSVLAERRFPCDLDYFGWGVLFCGIFVSPAYCAEERKCWVRAGYVGLFGVVPTMLLIACIMPMMDGHTLLRAEFYHGLAGIVAFLILFLIFAPTCLAVRFLSSPLLRFTGLISYEWYLLHEPVIFFARWWWGSAHANALRYMVILGVPVVFTFLVAAAIYHFYSLPILKWGRSRLSAKRPIGEPKAGTPAAEILCAKKRLE